MKKYSITPKHMFFNSWRSFLSDYVWAENLKDLCRRYYFCFEEELNLEALEKELENDGAVVINEYVIKVVEEFK